VVIDSVADLVAQNAEIVVEKQTHVTGAVLMIGNVDLPQENVTVKINNIVEGQGES